ncbi:Branched-chain alpha-keto acid dehydrogenase, E1 component, alpha subunit [Nitrincola lacisaponensis]|uniref:2-oxoisovalerate dehydrogenase subunit alpha n=1 Tax=Nitrincola lacisaponensis TaxID=267850 RepID=A0A063Y536_9GAMM|nr:thiamine pyrophosphate-dependent dehydrogenase E1 component subunit alpha [Nitrincola lacisaponensis]KDE39876.1 Branched-chain alpha-keto acid dehydrogenase, E1 component, alpha subunit [Nitrincola lacisaponensis]
MSDKRLTDAHIVHDSVFVDASALQIPTLRILQEDGTPYSDAVLPVLDKTLALKIYDTFLFIRALDERMLASQRQGRISFYMTETGEEAADIGSTAALQDDDMIMAQYREQGALAFRGFTPDQFMNQIFSNEQDLGKGRQMPIHYGSRQLHYMTVSSPLGTQLPQATGYAFALKAQQKPNCVICYFGEGAASEGDFHAALNMAGVFKVPVIFFCRNNGYAISTPAHEQYAGDGIAPRGIGYGLKTLRVDGNDVLAVLKATQEARKLAVEQHQPVLIEAMTYRLGAHSSSDDPSGYRNKSEEDTWRAKCPVMRFKKWLIHQDWWTEADDEQRKQQHRDQIMTAMKKAEKVPAPPLRDLFTDVYDQLPWHLQEQQQALIEHIRKYPQAYSKTAGRVDHE